MRARRCRIRSGRREGGCAEGDTHARIRAGGTQRDQAGLGRVAARLRRALHRPEPPPRPPRLGGRLQRQLPHAGAGDPARHLALSPRPARDRARRRGCGAQPDRIPARRIRHLPCARAAPGRALHGAPRGDRGMGVALLHARRRRARPAAGRRARLARVRGSRPGRPGRLLALLRGGRVAADARARGLLALARPRGASRRGAGSHHRAQADRAAARHLARRDEAVGGRSRERGGCRCARRSSAGH